MPFARFSLTASLSKVATVFLGIVCLVNGPATGQERKARTAPAQDRAQELMKREVDAKTKELDAMLARLKAFGPPQADVREPVAARVEVRAFPAAVQPVRVNGPIIGVEEVPADEDAVEGAPVRFVRVYTEQAFDLYVFGGVGNADQFRSRLESLLKMRVETLARSRLLTPQQKEKLHLAGRGDIKRQFAEIDAKRKEFDGLRRDLQKAGEFLRDLNQLRMLQSAPFGEGSLFVKVLANINNQIKENKDPQTNKPLPGSALAVDEAVARADVVAIARNIKTINTIGDSNFSIHCASTDIERCLKGNVAKRKLLLDAIPVSRAESLPSENAGQAYLLFIERSEGDGLRFHRVIKMLRSSEENAQWIEDHLKR